MLFDLHTLHGAEHMRMHKHPQPCAACSEPAYHECTTCRVALHTMGGKVWHNCHIWWHDPVLFGQLWYDKHGKSRKKRGGGTKRPKFIGPDARATAAALKRVKSEIAEELAADARMSSIDHAFE